MRLFATLAGAALAASGPNPIRRVVTLLQNMAKEIEEEGARDAQLYNKFQCYCNGNTDKMSEEAKAASAKIDDLKAAVENQTAEKTRVDAELVEHKSDRAAAQAAIESATALREKEHAKYTEEAGDKKGSLDALAKAIPALEKGMGGAVLLQTRAGTAVKRIVEQVSMDDYERRQVVSFLEGGDYAPQSGEIVGILKQIEEQISGDLNGIDKVEKAAAASFAKLIGAKQAEIQAASSAIEAKTERSGNLAVAIVESKNDLKDTTKSLGETQAFLANLASSCRDKAAEWDERQKSRSDEQAAIAETIKILNDDDALDMFKKTLGSNTGSSLLQTEDRDRLAARAQRARSLLAVTQQSTAVEAVSLLLKGKQVNFTKVIVMIDNMVAHLEKEQKDDDAHLEFCRTEFDAAGDKKAATEDHLHSLQVSIDEAKAAVEQYKTEVATLNAEIAEVDKQVQAATEQRKAENAEFQSAQTDVNTALDLLSQAENRLQKFYNPALHKADTTPTPSEEERIAGALSFVQEPAPETWEGEYKTKSQKSNGVVALIGMLKKDLETGATEAKHEEQTAQKDYEKLLADSAAQRAADVKAVTDKSAAAATLEGQVNDESTEQSASQEELQQVKTYIQQLHTSCDFLQSNFDFRKAARAQERDSLKNAKAALQGAKVELIQTGFLARMRPVP
jgi:chromosome segregation ATPase